MDHQRVNISTTAMSCGVLELSRISEETEEVIYSLGSYLYHPSRGTPAAFFVWSDICRDGTASDNLRNKLNELGVCNVELSETVENPKTGNHILIYVAAIRHEYFKKWYARKRLEKMKKFAKQH